MTSSGQITRQAVGRYEGRIGMLYDVRTDAFEGGSLFKKDPPESMIKSIDSSHVITEIDFNNSQKETFKKLNIDANMSLSIMGGLIKVSGSAKYLTQTKTDSRSVRISFIYNTKTKFEHLQISTAGLAEYISQDALNNLNATHVVIGVLWGANVVATFEQTVENHAAVEQLEGKLAASFSNVCISFKGEVSVGIEDKNNSSLESMKVSFSGDVPLEGVPRTMTDVMSTISTVPSKVALLNNGKGRQIEFMLYPLKSIAEMHKLDLQVERLLF